MTRESTLAPNYGVLRVQQSPMPPVLPRYSHRNGETEPPTTSGDYWFKGKHGGGSIATLVGVLHTYVELMGSDEMHPKERFVGQWWGPIVPPQEMAP